MREKTHYLGWGVAPDKGAAMRHGDGGIQDRARAALPPDRGAD
jgi:hypothetical protein